MPVRCGWELGFIWYYLTGTGASRLRSLTAGSWNRWTLSLSHTYTQTHTHTHTHTHTPVSLSLSRLVVTHPRWAWWGVATGVMFCGPLSERKYLLNPPTTRERYNSTIVGAEIDPGWVVRRKGAI